LLSVFLFMFCFHGFLFTKALSWPSDVHNTSFCVQQSFCWMSHSSFALRPLYTPRTPHFANYPLDPLNNG
jgi:hypothetical protein